MYIRTISTVHLEYRVLGLKEDFQKIWLLHPMQQHLHLMVMPEEACANLERLADEGFIGKYGFYEAIDYTSSRLQRGQSKAVVRSFMAHHEGMSFLSLAYVLLRSPDAKEV